MPTDSPTSKEAFTFRRVIIANSLPPVVIPSNKWVDIYAATGIIVGTKLNIQNTGANTVLLSESSTQPDLNFTTIGFNKIVPDGFLVSEDIPVGAWAYASTGSKLQVELT